jgi:hypothetical protein
MAKPPNNFVQRFTFQLPVSAPWPAPCITSCTLDGHNSKPTSLQPAKTLTLLTASFLLPTTAASGATSDLGPTDIFSIHATSVRFWTAFQGAMDKISFINSSIKFFISSGIKLSITSVPGTPDANSNWWTKSRNARFVFMDFSRHVVGDQCFMLFLRIEVLGFSYSQVIIFCLSLC